MSGRTAKKGTTRNAPGPARPGQAAPVKRTLDPVERQQMQALEEEKRQARLQRQVEERAVVVRRKRAALMRRNGILAVVALALIGVIAWLMFQEANKPGQGVAQEPSQHIKSVDVPHSYNSDPPTSGPHTSSLATWGVSSVPITKELEVHNLEDGGVIIDYRPDLDKATVDKLAELARSYDTSVIMAPYPGLSNAIVLTAWNRIDRIDSLDDARIRRFVVAYRGKDHHKDSGT